jgi:N-acylneuraminate cytidylyltransferase
MRVLALIPARGGSRRVPGKNLAQLGGRTLVRRALETALAATRVDAVALSSDNPDILAEAAGLDVLTLERPPELATDTALAYDVAAHALREADAARGPFDVLALVQCTTPFTAPEDLDGALALLERSGAASVVTVTEAPDLAHPLKLKRLDGDLLVPFLEDDALRPSHDLPELWVRNGAAYASRRQVLDAGILVAPDALGYRMPAERSVDVNTPLDLAFAEFLEARCQEGHAQ